jgi:hypothetical protein
MVTIMQKFVDDPPSRETRSQDTGCANDVSDHADDVLKLYRAALGGQRDVLEGP